MTSSDAETDFKPIIIIIINALSNDKNANHMIWIHNWGWYHSIFQRIEIRNRTLLTTCTNDFVATTKQSCMRAYADVTQLIFMQNGLKKKSFVWIAEY